MDKSLLLGLIGGAVAATAVAGIAGYTMMHHNEPDYAQVISVQEVDQTNRHAHKVCEQQPVTREAPVADQNRIAGTAVGAVLGGLLGDQIGNGNGRTVAALAGAAAGGYAGNTVQHDIQRSDQRTVMETRCHTEYSDQKNIQGYNVTYQLGSKQGMVHMNYNPGPRIPVKDGQLQLDTPVTNTSGS